MTDPNDATGESTGQPDGALVGDIVSDAADATQRSDTGDGTTANNDDGGSTNDVAIDPKNFPEQYRDALMQQPAEVQQFAEDMRKNLLRGFHARQEKFAAQERELQQRAQLGDEYAKLSDDPDFLEWLAAKKRGPVATPDEVEDLKFEDLDADTFTPTLNRWVDQKIEKMRSEERRRYEKLFDEKLNSSDVVREQRTTRALEDYYATIRGTTPPEVFRAAVLEFKAEQLKKAQPKQLIDFEPGDLIDRLQDTIRYHRLKHLHDGANPGTPRRKGTAPPSGTNAGGPADDRLPWQDANGNNVREPTEREKREHLGVSFADLEKKYAHLFSSGE